MDVYYIPFPLGFKLNQPKYRFPKISRLPRLSREEVNGLRAELKESQRENLFQAADIVRLTGDLELHSAEILYLRQKLEDHQGVIDTLKEENCLLAKRLKLVEAHLRIPPVGKLESN